MTQHSHYVLNWSDQTKTSTSYRGSLCKLRKKSFVVANAAGDLDPVHVGGERYMIQPEVTTSKLAHMIFLDYSLIVIQTRLWTLLVRAG